MTESVCRPDNAVWLLWKYYENEKGVVIVFLGKVLWERCFLSSRKRIGK
jgi:hypothetical protein